MLKERHTLSPILLGDGNPSPPDSTNRAYFSTQDGAVHGDSVFLYFARMATPLGAGLGSLRDLFDLPPTHPSHRATFHPVETLALLRSLGSAKHSFSELDWDSFRDLLTYRPLFFIPRFQRLLFSRGGREPVFHDTRMANVVGSSGLDEFLVRLTLTYRFLSLPRGLDRGVFCADLALPGGVHVRCGEGCFCTRSWWSWHSLGVSGSADGDGGIVGYCGKSVLRIRRIGGDERGSGRNGFRAPLQGSSKISGAGF